MKKFVFCALLVSVLVACHEDKGKATSVIELFSSEREMKAKEIVIDGNLGYHNEISSIGDYIVGRPYASLEYFFSIVDVTSGKAVNRLVPRGRGHNEASMIFLLKGSEGNLSFYDLLDREMITIKGTDALMPNPEIIFEHKKLEPFDDFSAGGNNITVLNDACILSTGYSKNHSTCIQISDPKGKGLATFSNLTFKEGTDQLTKMVSSGDIITTLDTNNILFSTAGGGVLRFFSYPGGGAEPKLIKEYFYFMPEYDVVRDQNSMSVTLKTESQIGLRSITASGDKFYALINKVIEIAGEDNNSKVLVFSSEGEPIEILKLDRKIDEIQYLRKTNSLYGFSVDEEGDNDLLIQYSLD